MDIVGLGSKREVCNTTSQTHIFVTHFDQLVACCDRSQIGKRLPGALYVHVSALPALEQPLQDYENLARQHLKKLDGATLVKFSTDQPRVSYLSYPDFDTNAHPALQWSVQVDLATSQVGVWNYNSTDNPPVLHRKETFITTDYPLYQAFAELTQQEEALGLLNNSRTIGTRNGWKKRLLDCGIQIQGHVLACPTSRTAAISQPKIDRHKAALVRAELSKPVRVTLEAGLFTPQTTFFDYGCGHGGDIEQIGDRGYTSSGWDPYYRPDALCTAADIVNLGYIINVIEDPAERREALLKAWALTGKVLIVAAQVLIEDRMRGMMAYSDGVITRRNTFQKNYGQEELKSYIDQVLGVDAIPVALGIYLVFRDEAQAQTFRASRFRSRATTPRIKTSIKRFEQYKEMLAPLMTFFTERGRLPIEEELQEFTALQSEFGTLRRAFQIVLQATELQEWDAIAEKRRQDLLVYLALSHFSHRPKLRNLAPIAQHDIKALFGNYQQACTAADLMLLSLGNLEVMAERCKSSAIGKKLSNSLWVHVSVLDVLDPLLRLYEGCASRTIGRPEEATVVKFHTSKPKISYLFYPDFDREPHPCLRTSMQIDLQDLHVSYRDYDPEDNPPVLHQKELLVQSDYPLYEKFAKLSRQEAEWGLLDDLGKIRDHQGWQKCLEENCTELKGHRLVWRKDADPYRVKLLNSFRRQRTLK
ncbi:DNA phosphorothioation-associated putative methyltransferase [Trichocoleus sp. FACHB-591]|uniref:DNA phosphorothioation-associated putative methyltransferase n=1 Tax=Trichocoleus sp. FACHB-591 TaxID=2692872 RepID=UPI0016878234|nr:DNA phosphorothioation-associated putative methyltransferase [Trichocoleus sp. FACHB-591]MBD2094461.1 DNA phosphorothioation-associated putative methyltransferase [Trichocoleus sp. FACHB-591]